MTSATINDALGWPATEKLARETGRRRDSARDEELQLRPLIECAKAGDQEAFCDIVGLLEKRIYNYLHKFTGNSHDAEDLAQETFLKAYRNINRHRKDLAFCPWIYTIAKRTALNHFRGKKVTCEFEDYIESDEADPLKALQKKEHSESIWALTEQLKPAAREALWLRYAEGFSIEETAAVLGRNQISIRVILHRARNELAKTLERQTVQEMIL